MGIAFGSTHPTSLQAWLKQQNEGKTCGWNADAVKGTTKNDREAKG